VPEPFIEDICQALKLEPGQRLILRFSPDRHMTKKDFDTLADLCAEAMPGQRFLIVEADEIAVAEPAEPDGGPAARLSTPATIRVEPQAGDGRA
jgi:hypothetical protein